MHIYIGRRSVVFGYINNDVNQTLIPMKTKVKMLIAGLAGCLLLALTPGFKPSGKNPLDHNHVKICGTKGCTFKTIFGEESSEGHSHFKNVEKVEHAVGTGLTYLASVQQKNGGWGAGSHSYQHIRDANAVSTDPATTAMVGMAMLRTKSTLIQGEYSAALAKATEYLLNAVETTPKDRLKITDLQGTQIQVKLGDNIDAVLAAQFFNNLLELEDLPAKTQDRIRSALADCVSRIQTNQNQDGSLKGDGWAGVLQSSYANQAVEAAEANGIDVDEDALVRSREFQKGNYDVSSGKVNTEKGAGVMLYAVSGSLRASAKEAKKAKDMIEEAKRRGEIADDAEISEELLEEIGLSKEESSRLNTSFNVFKSAKDKAQEDEVLDGFGNNGGEEFLSFLQTGESMVIAGGDEWAKWFDDTAGRIVHIQNTDGSWSGHHCITSPVFCTATCLLILSIDQDIERLQKMGDS
ncbi:MAG: hypothetical protein ABJH72_00790 [Reichenbachiella sp.]|uniref:hypothetical protein n=2 Tax=Reichenbachiella sp. TaxID=2184521 RepID=UPI00326794E6